MALKYKKTVISLAAAFAAVVVPPMAFVIEAGAEALKMSNQMRAETAQGLAQAALNNPQHLSELQTIADENHRCLEENAVPAYGIAQALTNWSDRLSFVPPASRALKEASQQEAITSMQEAVVCMANTLEKALPPISPPLKQNPDFII